MSQNCSLNELNPGETAVVKELKTRGEHPQEASGHWTGEGHEDRMRREEPGRRPGSFFDQRCGNRDTF